MWPKRSWSRSSCGDGTVRLKPEWAALFARLEALGRVTAITRNQSVVHEKHGVYAKVEASPMHILVVNPDIDLRLFPRAWAMAFMHEVKARDGVSRASRSSTASATRCTRSSRPKAATSPASPRSRATSRPTISRRARKSPRRRAPERDLPDWAVDGDALRAAWRDLKDTHDFFPLLKRLGLGRTQALRLAEPEMAWRVECVSVREVLTRASAAAAADHGVRRQPRRDPDPHRAGVARPGRGRPGSTCWTTEFNLHLREGDVTEAWLVRKPTVDGVVTALECFDRNGTPIVQFFGKRKPGIPELEAWRTLAESLPRLAAPAAAMA